MSVLPKYLNQSERLSESIGNLLSQHFVPVEGVTALDMFKLASGYDGALRSIAKPKHSEKRLTADQKYVGAILALLGPTISAAQSYQRICRARPKSQLIGRSRSFESEVLAVVHECYRFKERLKRLSEICKMAPIGAAEQKDVSKSFSSLIRNYRKETKPFLEMRNRFQHHEDDIDGTFSDLRLMEMVGVVVRADTQHIYEGLFREFRKAWKGNALRIVLAMNKGVFSVNVTHERYFVPWLTGVGR